MGPGQEGRHPVRGTPCEAGAESDRGGVAGTKHYLLTAPVPFCCSGGETEEGGWEEGRCFLLAFS